MQFRVGMQHLQRKQRLEELKRFALTLESLHDLLSHAILPARQLSVTTILTKVLQAVLRASDRGFNWPGRGVSSYSHAYGAHGLANAGDGIGGSGQRTQIFGNM